MSTSKPATTIVITSGKGGVGKTTSSAAISYALAALGKKTIVIDFDIGLRNLDLMFGAEKRIRATLIDVINEDISYQDAVITDRQRPNLHLLPASQTDDKTNLDEDGLLRLILKLKADYDYIICDSPAGIEAGAYHAMRFADLAIVITNPEISSVRDSTRIVNMLSKKSRKAETRGNMPSYLVVTRYDPDRVRDGNMMSARDITDLLGIPLIGIISESPLLLAASNIGQPITKAAPNSDIGISYYHIAERILGRNIPIREPAPTSRGLFHSIKKSLGLSPASPKTKDPFTPYRSETLSSKATA